VTIATRPLKSKGAASLVVPPRREGGQYRPAGGARILTIMRSVADDLRREQRQKLSQLTAAERVALALRLGRRDVETFAATRGLSLEYARELIRRRSQRGRRASPCMSGKG
jgi:hypothetical protein